MLFREVEESQYGTPDFSSYPPGYLLTREWQDAYRPEWLFFDVEPFFWPVRCSGPREPCTGLPEVS